MHCPNCGHQNDNEARFCGECGTAMPQSPPPPPPPPPVSASPPPNRESSWQPGGGGPGSATPVVSNGLKWGVAAGTLLVPVLGIVMGIIFIVDANPAKKSVGKLWLWVGIAVMFFWCVIGFIGGFADGLQGY